MGKDAVLRTIFAAALLAGVSYAFVDPSEVAAPSVVWKGAGVALLAVWCALQARSRDGWLITAVMAFGALGDVLLETSGLTTGALAFLAGHVLAIILYRRNQRSSATKSQRLLAWTVLLFGPLTAATIILDIHRDGPPVANTIGNDAYLFGIVCYSVVLSMMAAGAWTSRFPRYRTGFGAMMFLASDLLIFAGLGPLSGSMLPGELIWPLYFAGQALIASGVVRTLRTADIGSTP